MVVHASVYDRVTLILTVEKHRWRQTAIVTPSELAQKLIFALLTIDVDEGKLDVTLPHALVKLHLVPVRHESLAGIAVRINEANNPDIAIIVDDRALKCVQVEAARLCPHPVVYLGCLEGACQVGCVRLHLLECVPLTVAVIVAKVLNEDGKRIGRVNAPVFERLVLILTVKQNCRCDHPRLPTRELAEYRTVVL